MRVDFVITELNVGGAEKALTELAIGMHLRGHRVRVLSIGSAPSADRHRLVDRLLEQNVSVEFGGFNHWSRLVSATRWLAQHLRKDSPEVCQTFLFHANCLGTIAAKHAGIRHVVGGLRVAEANHIRMTIEKKAIRRMSHVVCVSEQVRSFAIKILTVNPQHCSAIPNGVDVATYRDAKPTDWSTIGWPTDCKVALFVGRLHQQKGIELIQQESRNMLGRDSERRLLLIGDGPLRDSLSHWASEMGDDRVRLLPWQNDVTPFIKAATMLILPSHYEGMPNVVLEAMAAGRPAVFSRVEGSAEILGDPAGVRCIRQGFAPGNGPRMTDLVDAFFRDAELCQSIGHANQVHVETQFSNRQMIERYEALYASLLSD